MNRNKWNELFESAALVLEKKDLAKFALQEGQNDPRQFTFISELYGKAVEDALDAIYDDHCDHVILDRYKKFRFFMNLYKEYRDEKYAIGS